MDKWLDRINATDSSAEDIDEFLQLIDEGEKSAGESRLFRYHGMYFSLTLLYLPLFSSLSLLFPC